MSEKHTAYQRERDAAANAKIAASMELKLHGIPRNREARQRLERALGNVLVPQGDDGEASGRYDPLRFGMNRPWGQ